MTLDEYLKSKISRKKRAIVNRVRTFNFPSDNLEVVNLQLSDNLKDMVNAAIPPETEYRSNYWHGRFHTLANEWCENNCHSKWGKLGSPSAWAFEDPAEALMFKLTWTF